MWHALGFITRRDDVTASAAHLLKRLPEVALLDGLLRLADYPLRRLPEQPAGNARRQQSRDQYRENYGADMFALSHGTNVPFVPSSAICVLAFSPSKCPTDLSSLEEAHGNQL